MPATPPPRSAPSSPASGTPAGTTRPTPAPRTCKSTTSSPVHEPYGSGARTWTKERRIAVYNDLGKSRIFGAQAATLNSVWGSRGPEKWLPPKNRCAYVGQGVAVEKCWCPTVDKTEKAALTKLADSCPEVIIKVTKT